MADGEELFNFNDFIGETPLDTENPDIPTPLTQAKNSSLTTLHIEYIDDLPEYPVSHIHGFCYVVAARGRSQLEMEQLAHDVSTS
ncbi:hypothetical protein BJX76DRAFT_172465 [Aspergillus varians]